MKEKNIEKGLNYKEQIIKLSKAIKNEYYYEALIIDYAIMEDRLEAILYYLNLLNDNRDRLNKNYKRIKQEVLRNSKKSYIKLSEISSKIELIEFLLNNYESDLLYNLNPKYFKILRKKMKSIDMNSFIKNLNDIKKWKEKRNQIIHCLMKNKLDIDISQIAEDGFVLARELDRHCGFIKRKNIIGKLNK